MRKLTLFAVFASALVAFLAVSVQAFAAADPACDGDPYDNTFALHDATLTSTDTGRSHAPSGISGGGIACGTDIQGGIDYPGWQTLNDNADIGIADGVVVTPTESPAHSDGIPLGSFAGHTTVNAASWGLGIPVIAQNQAAEVKVDTLANCDAENQITAGGPVPGTVIACYKGVTTGSIPGHNWDWTTQATDGSLTLTIGPFYNDLTPAPAGLTRIEDFSLCRNAGDVGASDCGDGSDPVMQYNGDVSHPDCANGNGIYSITVTNKSAATTPAVDVCARWFAVKRAPTRLGVVSNLAFERPATG